MKTLVVRPGTVAPDLGLPVATGIPPRYRAQLLGYVDHDYVVVRECWDGITVFPGPLTQADVDAISDCEPDPSKTEVATISSMMDDFRDAIPASDPAKVKPDIALLVAFAGNASPTNAQAIAAIKAQSRLIASLARRLLR